MGAALKARLLVQNPGQVPVMVHVPTWHQGQVKASDAKGAEVEVSGISWMTIAQLVPVRLGPGEFIEINAPGIGLGPRAGIGPWAGPRVGSNVLAKVGDELTLKHGLVPLDGSEVGVRDDDPHVAGPGWWLAHIRTRLNRELPLPACRCLPLPPNAHACLTAQCASFSPPRRQRMKPPRLLPTKRREHSTR